MRIKELIKEKGFTQKDFAEKLGMTTQGLTQIMVGKPSLTTMEKIASALGVEVWELLISRDEVVSAEATHQKDNNSIICPHCGRSIRINVEAE